MAEQTILIGQRIAQARSDKGMTQAELAAKIPGKSDGTQVSKWERGQHRPSDDTLEHIARVLKNGNVAWFMVPEKTQEPTPALMDTLEPSDVAARLDYLETRQTYAIKLLERIASRGVLEAVRAEFPELLREEGPDGASSRRRAR